ncbi:MAG TPA: energy transducer TonB [Candidatus Acidoferrum sp.]|nr:energy transducer TonB [Candidatus Acidoferrum sp.]
MGKYWQQRSINFELFPIYRFSDALDVVSHLRRRAQQENNKIKERREKGRKLECVVHESDRRQWPDAKDEICIDAATGYLADVRWPDRDEVTDASFDDYLKLGDKGFPKEIKLMMGHQPLLVLTVTDITSPIGVGDTDLRPFQGSQPWGTCANPQLPSLASEARQVFPVYPEQDKLNHIQGIVRIYAVIEEDGSVSNLKVLSAPDTSLASATVSAISHWKYHPEVCGATPIRREMIIDTTFTLGG